MWIRAKMEAKFRTFVPVKIRRAVSEMFEWWVNFFVLDLGPNHLYTFNGVPIGRPGAMSLELWISETSWRVGLTPKTLRPPDCRRAASLNLDKYVLAIRKRATVSAVHLHHLHVPSADIAVKSHDCSNVACKLSDRQTPQNGKPAVYMSVKTAVGDEAPWEASHDHRAKLISHLYGLIDRIYQLSDNDVSPHDDDDDDDAWNLKSIAISLYVYLRFFSHFPLLRETPAYYSNYTKAAQEVSYAD